MGLWTAMFGAWPAEQVEAAGTVASAVLSLATTVVAVMVYLEARSIRKVEWFSKTSENWQGFNKLVLDAGYTGRWWEILNGKVGWAELDQKDRMVIYSFLNVLVFEFNAQRRQLLDRTYAQKSVMNNVLCLHALWPDLCAHLRTDGWPDDFLDLADDIVMGSKAVAFGLNGTVS